MPECYFLYYEELDWCTMIKNAGFQLWYVHDSVILHKESISTGKMTPFKTYYMNRSRIIYMRRNLFGGTFLVSLLFQVFISIPKNVALFFFKGEGAHLKAYNKALLWHLTHLNSKEIHDNKILNIRELQ